MANVMYIFKHTIMFLNLLFVCMIFNRTVWKSYSFTLNYFESHYVEDPRGETYEDKNSRIHLAGEHRANEVVATQLLSTVASKTEERNYALFTQMELNFYTSAEENSEQLHEGTEGFGVNVVSSPARLDLPSVGYSKRSGSLRRSVSPRSVA